MRTPTTVDNSVGFRLALIQDQGVSLEESQVGYLVTSDAVCYHPAWQVPVYRMPAGVVVYKEGNHGLVVSLTTANQMYFSDIAYGNKNPKPLSHTPAVSRYDWVCGTSNQYFSMWGGGYGCVDILDFLDKIRYFAGGDIIQNYHDIWTSTMPSQTSAYGFRRNGDGIYKESFTLSSNLQVLHCFAFPKAENEPSFSPASFSLTNTGVGSTATLTVSYLGDGTVTASSNNTGIATVTPLSASEGTATFTVTGVSEGSTTLNVQIAEGSKHLAYTGSGVVSVNVGEYKSVDLGLPSGTKWATCNIGAASPEDYGDYFAWAPQNRGIAVSRH